LRATLTLLAVAFAAVCAGADADCHPALPDSGTAALPRVSVAPGDTAAALPSVDGPLQPGWARPHEEHVVVASDTPSGLSRRPHHNSPVEPGDPCDGYH
jgi:hypothetical protein